jgi:hypothetical protein
MSNYVLVYKNIQSSLANARMHTLRFGRRYTLKEISTRQSYVRALNAAALLDSTSLSLSRRRLQQVDA